VFSVLRREEGQGLAEYALILSLISILVIGSLVLIRGDLTAFFSRIGTAL